MSWELKTLGDISISIQTGPFGSQLHQSDYSEEGTPVVMPKDLIGGKISEETIARVSSEHVERLKRHKIIEGDILYSRRGDVGRCAFTTEREKGWLCGTGCLRVTIDRKIADPSSPDSASPSVKPLHHERQTLHQIKDLDKLRRTSDLKGRKCRDDNQALL